MSGLEETGPVSHSSLGRIHCYPAKKLLQAQQLLLLGLKSFLGEQAFFHQGSQTLQLGNHVVCGGAAGIAVVVTGAVLAPFAAVMAAFTASTKGFTVFLS